MNTITIQSLKVPTLIGVYATEQNKKQELLVDITFSIDIEKATSKDLLSDTIDYAEIRLTVLKFAAENHFNLLESFAQKLKDYLKNKFNLSNLILSVTKFPTGMPDTAGVKITTGPQ